MIELEQTEFNSNTPPELCRKLRHAVAHIDQNLQKNLSLTDLAAIAEMNPQYFARTFKNWVGLPPHRYIIEKRIERAKFLLETTELSLSDIASEVGIASQSHFTTLFHRVTGMTPREYREK